MIVEKLRQKIVAKKSYKANITAVVEEMEVEQKRSKASLAKIFGVLRKKKNKRCKIGDLPELYLRNAIDYSQFQQLVHLFCNRISDFLATLLLSYD